MYHFQKFIILTIIVVINGIGSIVFAAPDPSEVEKIKQTTPIHIIGEVIQDEFVKDLSEEKGTNLQIRKMTIEVNKFIKNNGIKEKKLDVYYRYIPKWQSYLWVGGERVDITEKDVIEIWLDKGEYGLEPALGGNTINHLKYVKPRNEPIKEPLIHKLKGKLEGLWDQYSSISIFFILVIIFVFITLSAKQKRSKIMKNPFE